MVYLIHFSSKYHHARHYLGYASDLGARIERHRSGDGAKLLRAVQSAGIEWSVVRTWPDGTRDFERKLKRRKKASRLCPICAKERKDGKPKRTGRSASRRQGAVA